jgi:hypothetical protein
MFTRTIYGDSPSVISSRGSASGPMPCDLPGGRTTDPSGRGPVPANLSPRLAKAWGLLTSGTYGPRGIGSSASVALAQFLANRLQARTRSLGSTLYKLTWKERVTPAGRSIYALRASVRRTSVSDCTGQPVLTGWVTPSARDWRDTPGMATERPDGRSRLDQLPRQANLVNLDTPARRTVSGEMLIGSSAGMGNGGRLNPAHPRWLMGLPSAWDVSEPAETP